MTAGRVGGGSWGGVVLPATTVSVQDLAAGTLVSMVWPPREIALRVGLSPG